MTDPRSSILADEQVRQALLHALDEIETTLGREEIGHLRDIVRVLIDPWDSKSQKFVRYLIETQREKAA